MVLFKSWRRRRIRRQPFPDGYLQILRTRVPYYQKLPKDKQQELRESILIFLDEKNFEGCAGLEISDEIRITVAAQACILILGEITDFYPALRSILVYPRRYVASFTEHRQGGVVIEGQQYRLGESWSSGNVVLAWDEVKKGASDIHDGYNLVFHEFAHQLDHEYGASSQIQAELPSSSFLPWARVLSREYDELVKRIREHHPTLFDSYGASSPEEFFAVSCELFFEKPVQLKKEHPDLYEQLEIFFKQDPAEYLERSTKSK